MSAAASIAAAAPAGAAGCADRLLPAPAAGDPGPVIARSLIALRDFGRSDSGAAGALPFSVSPDGKWAALILRRADPDSNAYCLGVLLVPLDRPGAPRLIDVGGEFIAARADLRGVADIVNGSADGSPPVWSPDSRAVAYLRRDKGSTQAWRATIDGGARRLTALPGDVRDIRWTQPGSIAISTRDLRDANDAIAAEGRTGFLYDRRFWAISDARPRPMTSVPIVWLAVNPRNGEIVDKALTASPPVGDLANQSAKVQRDYSAWLAPDAPARFGAPARLHVARGGKELPCPETICALRIASFWFRTSEDLIFLAGGTPDNGGRVSLWRWRLDLDALPRRILETLDALVGCALAGPALICAHESARSPRRLVRIDPATGAMTPLFDPNPEFEARRAAPAERIRWTDPEGVASYGDLVLPPDRKPGERHPLIVVQYTSQGFLRGGVGDEFPIQAFAAHGYAVLSVQRPVPVARGSAATDLNSYQRINVTGWADRRRILAGVEAGIDAAIARGVIDSERIGITGLSDGAATVQYALIHSRRIKAAAIGSCCESPSVTALVGPAYTDVVLQWGYPPPGAEDPGFWQPYSLAANAGRIHVPLLMQLADSEFRMALETYAALEHAGAPVEMYVFPDEHHVKVQPAHRLAIYDRNLAWFDFWLRGIETSSTQSPETMRRWRALKTRAR